MLDERNHVEKPLLEQLEGLGWEIIGLDDKQLPADSHRETFTEVVMLPVLGEQLKVINPWIEDDQIEEVTKQLIANFPGTGLIENNKHVLNLLLENTSVSENRQTGENSPTVRFIDFENRDKNRFTAVCQYKVRILGTEHHIFPDIVLFVNGLPVVLIECKSPRVKDAIPEAIDQICAIASSVAHKAKETRSSFILTSLWSLHAARKPSSGRLPRISKSIFIAGLTLTLERSMTLSMALAARTTSSAWLPG